VKVLTRLVPAAGVVACLAGFASPAFASTASSAGSYSSGTVFVQTDNTSGNQIAVYDREPGGSLVLAGTYNTGGLGGQLSGSVVDHLASQGSLQYDRHHRLLFAVNAGSNTISVFAVRGDRLELRQVLGSGGTFPNSITVHGDIVYVLNALNGGSVNGFRITNGHLAPIPGSARELGLGTTASSPFVDDPGQVAFTPDGSQLIVTTKATDNDIDVFGVGWGGWLSASPTVNSEPGTVPFAIAYDRYGHVLIAEAGTDALASFAISPDGTLTQIDSAATGQAATCWVARAGRYFFASNAGSGSVTGFTSSRGGELTSTGDTATDAGTTDAVATGGFLYVRAGADGIVDEFAIGAGGSLASVGSVTVAGAVGGEGIAAS
jgi:6-phosphogluconolactonase (cycloisomerase 2 family)